MNSEQVHSSNLSKSNDTTCSSNSSRLACDSPSGHFTGVLRAKAGTQQPAKDHSSAPLDTITSPCSSGGNTTASSHWSSSTDRGNRSTIKFRVTKTNTGTAHKSTTSSSHHSSRPRARFSDVRCCPQRPPGDGGGGPSFLPQRPTSSQHLAACQGRHFRPDLDHPTQRSALTAHIAETRNSFVEKAQRQASMAVRTSIELPLPNALSQNYGGAPNDGESGVTSRDLAWALRSQIVEAYRYQQKRRMEEEQRGGGDNGTYGGPCDASAPPPSHCLPFSHPPPPPPPFIATADFCRTVLEDIDTIFRICEQKDGEAAGSQRAYFHTKEQLNNLQMWRI